MNFNNIETQLFAINWYKSLTLHQKMELRDLTMLICGMRWEDFNILFSPRERLEILYNKLKLEGFII